jgi:hypothetical protein
MTYGHAERTLAAVRLLEAETRELLSGLDHLDPEHARWLRDAAESASLRLRSAGAAPAQDQACGAAPEPAKVRHANRVGSVTKPSRGR